jgi:hypothetical protein
MAKSHYYRIDGMIFKQVEESQEKPIFGKNIVMTRFSRSKREANELATCMVDEIDGLHEVLISKVKTAFLSKEGKKLYKESSFSLGDCENLL